jgi:hypothetical protein
MASASLQIGRRHITCLLGVVAHVSTKQMASHTSTLSERLQNGIDKSGHQVGMAWVELEFDNSDRRIILSGVCFMHLALRCVWQMCRRHDVIGK